MSKQKSRIIFTALVLLAVFAIAVFYEPAPLETSDEISDIEKTKDDEFDYPPSVYVNDILYGYEREVSEEYLDKSDTYIGTIESSVPASQVPKENFQANDPIVGSEIYQSGSDIIVIHNGHYNLYCP